MNGKDLRNIQSLWINTEYSDSIRVYYCCWNSYIIRLSVYTANENYLISAVLEMAFDFEPDHIILKHQLKRNFATLFQESEEFIRSELIKICELPEIVKFCKTNKIYCQYDIKTDYTQLKIGLGSKYLSILSSGITLQDVIDGIINYWQSELKEKGIRKYAKMVYQE